MKLFEDTQTAFALKTDAQLRRAHLLFRFIAGRPVVRIATAIARLGLKMGLPIPGFISRTVFRHFCGGITQEDCLPAMDELYGAGVHSILDYSVEGKEIRESLDNALGVVMQLSSFAADKEAMPFSVFKPTAFGRSGLWENVNEDRPLTEEEQAEWQRVAVRYDTACLKAQDDDVPLLIDAEESWMQGAADDLALDMMRKYNREKAVVYNTLQCYRYDRFEYLKELHRIAKEEGFILGIKLVRGAYMEKERKRAEKKGYESPICKDKAETDANFEQALRYGIENIGDIHLFLGSHNEASSYLAMELMEQNGLAKNDTRLWFAQLYGMSDHISFNLARAGYNVAKYVPFGPVREVMPYLIRRSEENTSVRGQTSRELGLIRKELERRERQ